MKIVFYTLILLFSMYANADICGTTKSSFSDGGHLILESEDLNSTPITVRANSANAKKFASQVIFLGAAICDINASYEAPFKVCFVGDEKSNLASEFYCGDNSVCSGTGCGSR